jgi:hypothetical protein
MPRRSTRSSAGVTDAVDALLEAVTGLVGAVRSTIDSGRRVGVAARDAKVVASAKGKKLQRSLKSYWANLRGPARAERIRKMLAGRGLVPKSERAAGRGRGKTAARGARRGRTGRRGARGRVPV